MNDAGVTCSIIIHRKERVSVHCVLRIRNYETPQFNPENPVTNMRVLKGACPPRWARRGEDKS
jgi:hypothetical protein